MKYITVLLLVSFAANAVAQRFHTCLVYQYAGNDTGKKHLVLTQKFNGKGKLASETAHEYADYWIESGNQMSMVKEDGRYYYKYSDTLLVSSIYVHHTDYLPNCDTIKTFNFYDKTQKKILEVTAKHNTPTFSLDPPGTFEPQTSSSTFYWEQPDSTFYFYNPLGLLKEIHFIPRKPLPNELFSEEEYRCFKVYDEERRTITDSEIVYSRYKNSITTKHYTYSGKECTEYINTDEFSGPYINKYHSDTHKRIIEADEYDTGLSEIASTSPKPTNEYNLVSKTTYKYDAKGNVVEMKIYKGKKLTTTRSYVYK